MLSSGTYREERDPYYPPSLYECRNECFEKASCDEVETRFCMGPAPGSALDACLVECGLAHPICQADLEQPGCMFLQCVEGSITLYDSVCDGTVDCADGRDEMDCATFACKDGTSILAPLECDRHRDCPDGSDEHDGCARPQCQND